MRTFDFTPFTRSAIGFDHLFDLLNNQTAESVENYPPMTSCAPGKTPSALTSRSRVLRHPTSTSPREQSADRFGPEDRD